VPPAYRSPATEQALLARSRGLWQAARALLLDLDSMASREVGKSVDWLLDRPGEEFAAAAWLPV
jgi:hypothetical protein